MKRSNQILSQVKPITLKLAFSFLLDDQLSVLKGQCGEQAGKLTPQRAHLEL